MRVYLHWPFCLSRCSYCDFNTRVAGVEVMRRYRASLLEEARMWSRMLPPEKRPLESLYLGGGTPSTLSGGEVAGLVDEIGFLFGMSETSEVSVEVNPATWSYDDFARAREGGVNRFSIGLQSTQDDVLRLLRRAHDSGEAKEAVREALRCDASSVSVDLLYGLPGMDCGTLRHSLWEVLDMGVHHLSLYALTLAGRTPLARMVTEGEVTLPDEDEVADQYMEASAVLEEAGYHRYEISNFCMPGHRCRHNLAYWRREEYLGIGAGAHSLLGRCRFNNTPSLLAYMSMMRKGTSAVEQHQALEYEDEREEEVMLGLRTSLGVPRRLLGNASSRLFELEKGGFLAEKEERIYLTTRGILVSNAVIAELLMGDVDRVDALDGRS